MLRLWRALRARSGQFTQTDGTSGFHTFGFHRLSIGSWYPTQKLWSLGFSALPQMLSYVPAPSTSESYRDLVARLVTTGFELADLGTVGQSGNVTDGVVSSVTAVTDEATIVRSGAKSRKCNSGAGNTVAYVQPMGGGQNLTTNVTIFSRFYIYIENLPDLETAITTIITNYQSAQATDVPVVLTIDSAGLIGVGIGSPLTHYATGDITLESNFL
jgi:hypothetical protein